MKRRAFLGGLALAPMTGRAAMKEVAARVAGSSAALMASNAAEVAGVGLASSGPLKLTSFLKYALKRERDWQRQARNVTQIDPDLLSMHLPLTTLFRMQRARNYERIKEDEELNFKNIVARDGSFSFWE